MSDKPKRRFWQLHLSTAVAMMLLAGLMIWPNVVPNPSCQYVGAHVMRWTIANADYYGWPAAFAWRLYSVETWATAEKGEPGPMKLYWVPGLFIDVAVIALCVVTLACLSESFLRHREGSQDMSEKPKRRFWQSARFKWLLASTIALALASALYYCQRNGILEMRPLLEGLILFVLTISFCAVFFYYFPTITEATYSVICVPIRLIKGIPAPKISRQQAILAVKEHCIKAGIPYEGFHCSAELRCYHVTVLPIRTGGISWFKVDFQTGEVDLDT
jgi:hypothetical protein